MLGVWCLEFGVVSGKEPALRLNNPKLQTENSKLASIPANFSRFFAPAKFLPLL